MEEIREASEKQKMFATQIADVHIIEPYLITKYKPLLNSEFISTDYTTLFKIDFDINKFERFEV